MYRIPRLIVLFVPLVESFNRTHSFILFISVLLEQSLIRFVAYIPVVGYYEPAPKTIERGSEDPEKYYSIQKAKLIPATFIFVCKKK